MKHTDRFAANPLELTQARLLCHSACQWPSRAARANLPAQPDDSHSALTWRSDAVALASHSLGPSVVLGFSFDTRALLMIHEGAPREQLVLDGKSEDEIGQWVDENLLASGLARATSAEMPYTLEPVSYASFAESDITTKSLGAWFASAADALTSAVERHGHNAVHEPAVRCWPHHFDIATLFALEEGDPETARSIGAGLSPGDESYAEPYIYCTPWPIPEALRSPPARMRWHTEGFTSLVRTVSTISPDEDLTSIFDAAVAYLVDY